MSCIKSVTLWYSSTHRLTISRMSFFKKFKDALGLSEDSYADLKDDEPIEYIEPASRRRPASSPEKEQFGITETSFADYHEKEEPVDLGRLKYDIFDKVLEVFNASLPDFLKNSVDPEAQKKYLFDSLGSEISQYFSRLEVMAADRGEKKYREELAKAKNEVEEMKRMAGSVDEQRRKIQENRLSADRQKRALNDRIRDLEASLETALADREQLDLENKGLLNKLRLASLEGGALPEGDITALQAQQTAEIEALTKERDDLRATLDNLKDKDRMATELYNDSLHTVALLKAEVEKRDSEIAELKTNIQTFEELRHQLEQVDDAISRRDEVIISLKNKARKFQSDLKTREEEVSKLSRQIESLNSELREARSEREDALSKLEKAESLNDELNAGRLEDERQARIQAQQLEETRLENERLEAERRMRAANLSMKISDSELEEIERKFKNEKEDSKPTPSEPYANREESKPSPSEPSANTKTTAEANDEPAKDDLATEAKAEYGESSAEIHASLPGNSTRRRKRRKGPDQHSLPFQLSLF